MKRALTVLSIIFAAGIFCAAIWQLNERNKELEKNFEKVAAEVKAIPRPEVDKTDLEGFVNETDLMVVEEQNLVLKNKLEKSDPSLEAKVGELREMLYRQISENDISDREIRSIVEAIAEDLGEQEYRDDPTRAAKDLSPLAHILLKVDMVTHNIRAEGSVVALSGFVIKWENEPLVITAGHFLPESGTVYDINCFFGDGSPSTTLEFVGLSPVFDFAVFKFKKEYVYDREFFLLGNSSDLNRLSAVITLGSPLVFSHGIHFLSGYGYVMSPDFHSNYSGTQPGVILHLAITNSGNSGGPLLDSRGRVVGITVGVMEKRNVTIDTKRGEMNLKVETNMYTATPIDDVKKVLPKVIRGGRVRHGQLRGLQLEPSSLLPEKNFKKLGIEQPDKNDTLVVAVGAKTAAETAGFKVGDIIIAVDGKSITHPNDFAREVVFHEAGEQVSITVKRKGELLKLPVTLEAFAPSLPPVRIK